MEYNWLPDKSIDFRGRVRILGSSRARFLSVVFPPVWYTHFSANWIHRGFAGERGGVRVGVGGRGRRPVGGPFRTGDGAHSTVASGRTDVSGRVRCAACARVADSAGVLARRGKVRRCRVGGGFSCDSVPGRARGPKWRFDRIEIEEIGLFANCNCKVRT